MRTNIASDSSQLSRLALATSRRIGLPVEGLRADDRPPTFFASGTVLVNASAAELIDSLVGRGGRVVSGPEVPPMPDELRRLDLGRPEGEVDPGGQPRLVEIRFDDVPAAADEHDHPLSRVWSGVEQMEWSSPAARALAGLVASLQADGKPVSLDYVLEPRTLPVSAPHEGLGLVYGDDPLLWPTLNQRSRIADAWQLVESMRLMRSVSGVEFIGICDTGFAPGSGGDIISGGLQWDAVADKQGLPGGMITDFHGTEVAGTATAFVGNNMGTAGSGGTVAVPAYFQCGTISSTIRAIVRCTYWGIHIVNISRGVLFDQVIVDLHLDWGLTFAWAADNGVLIVCAAPNENVEIGGDQGDFPSTVSDRALAVGNLLRTDLPSACAYGSGVDIWAPGTGIPLIPTPANPMGSSGNGTSYAAPLVCGVVAMMRAVNSSLSPDQLRDILLKTAWTVPGTQAKGMDAYAAVLEAMRAGIAESSLESPPERLFPAADGSFKPVFNDGFNRAGDVDTFTLEAKQLSDVTVELHWYNRISTARLELESTVKGQTVDTVVTSAAAGQAVLTATVGPGTYRLTVQGNGTSAYLLSGSLHPAVLHADAFEANDTFETATRLRVLPRTKWEIGGFLDHSHGPGSFDLNLHTDGTGPATRDVDFFVIDVPTDVGLLHEAQIQITGSDAPLEITLFDAGRKVLVTRHLTALTPGITLGLPSGQTVYVKVSGAIHTRYRLWVGAYYHDEQFHRLWPEVRLLPHWWEENILDTFAHPHEHRAVVVTPELLQDGVLALGSGAGHALPEGLHVNLLDREGAVLRSGVVDGGVVVVELEGIPPGGYVLETRLAGDALRIARAGGLGLSLQPPPRQGH